jgi:hypothetical protein
VELGRTDVALDVLAKRGDWDRLWEVAAKEKMATSTIAKFIIMRVEEVTAWLISSCLVSPSHVLSCSIPCVGWTMN